MLHLSRTAFPPTGSEQYIIITQLIALSKVAVVSGAPRGRWRASKAWGSGGELENQRLFGTWTKGQPKPSMEWRFVIVVNVKFFFLDMNLRTSYQAPFPLL